MVEQDIEKIKHSIAFQISECLDEGGDFVEFIESKLPRILNNLKKKYHNNKVSENCYHG